MRANTCKFYTGSFLNTHCDAGVCYRDVTTEPDRERGIAFRIPCVLHDMPLTNSRSRPLSVLALAEYEKRGSCDKFELPTDEELDADEAATKARIKEVLESIAQGVVPEGVIVCGPSTPGSCKCDCPRSCEHVWDGEVVEEDGDARISTVTCSRCGKWAINHDMWVADNEE